MLAGAVETLVEAALAGDAEAVASLLEHGLPPDSRVEGSTALARRLGDGWLGVLAATIAGAATPGGPVVGFSIGAVALKVGGGTPQVIAYVISWALFAFQRLILWEIPFMPAKFVWFRAAVSLPFPFLAAALSMAIGKP